LLRMAMNGVPRIDRGSASVVDPGCASLESVYSLALPGSVLLVCASKNRRRLQTRECARCTGQRHMFSWSSLQAFPCSFSNQASGLRHRMMTQRR